MTQILFGSGLIFIIVRVIGYFGILLTAIILIVSLIAIIGLTIRFVFNKKMIQYDKF
jgi:uncharacterized protein YybS (DUF2232 family)